MNDTKLVTRAQQGDLTAFTGLVESYQTAVYNLCYRMLGDAHDAEDAAQETFLRAYHQLRRYDPARPFSTWLLSIASHYCIDQLRKRRWQWLSLEDEVASSHPALQLPKTPEDITIRRENTRQMRAWLNRLDPASRQIVVLRYWYDLSYEEIAEAVGVTVGAIKSRLHRAREALVRHIEPTLHRRVEQAAAQPCSMVI
jgi:RNA polymerase sigma-70 factor (ECF subfamily)